MRDLFNSGYCLLEMMAWTVAPIYSSERSFVPSANIIFSITVGSIMLTKMKANKNPAVE